MFYILSSSAGTIANRETLSESHSQHGRKQGQGHGQHKHRSERGHHGKEPVGADPQYSGGYPSQANAGQSLSFHPDS